MTLWIQVRIAHVRNNAHLVVCLHGIGHVDTTQAYHVGLYRPQRQYIVDCQSSQVCFSFYIFTIIMLPRIANTSLSKNQVSQTRYLTPSLHLTRMSLSWKCNPMILTQVPTKESSFILMAPLTPGGNPPGLH